jgi:16S rRNA (uracil1498-N3)-methyltransferase
MRKIFVLSKDIDKDTIRITDAGKIHHLKVVLRARIGQALSVFDELGKEYSGLIEAISAQGITVKISKKKQALLGGPKFNLTLAVAIPKKAKFDDIVDKLTQLGVVRIIPMKTSRTVVRLEPRAAQARLERWMRIARSAAEQSRRNGLPDITPVKDIEEVAVQSQDYDLKLIPALAEKQRSLKQVLAGVGSGNIIVLIGPEGDFSPKELAFCKKAGFIPVTLGKSVLRVDTAAVAAASYIMLNSI